jgi:hypothetical protein
MGVIHMGMYMSFTRVTPEELEKAATDPQWARDCVDDLDRADEHDGHLDLDKAWDGIQFLLDRAGLPIELQLDGESISEDPYLTGWTVDDVKDAARHLRATPFEQLVRHFDPAQMMKSGIYPRIWDRDPAEDDVLGYLKESYELLVRFFDAAAASKSAAIMSFG